MQTKQAEKIIDALVSDKKLVDYIQSKVVSRGGSFTLHSREYISAIDACIEEAFNELNIIQLVADHYAEKNRRKKIVTEQNDIPELTFSEQEPHQVKPNRRSRRKQDTHTSSSRNRESSNIDLSKTRRFSKDDFSHTQLLSTETSLHESSESTVEFNRIPKEAKEVRVEPQEDDTSFPLHDSPLRQEARVDCDEVSSHHSSDVVVEEEVINGYLGDDNRHDEDDDDPWNEHVALIHEERRRMYVPHSDPLIDDYCDRERNAEDQIDQLSRHQQQQQINQDMYPQSIGSQPHDDDEVENGEEDYTSDFHGPVSEEESQSNRRVRFPNDGVVSELIYSRHKYTPAEVAELFYSADEAYYFQVLPFIVENNINGLFRCPMNAKLKRRPMLNKIGMTGSWTALPKATIVMKMALMTGNLLARKRILSSRLFKEESYGSWFLYVYSSMDCEFLLVRESMRSRMYI